MKLSRDWLSDYVDLTDLSDDELSTRFTEIGHAVESVERHADDTVFDLEITTNRVDAMSHLGMARELAAALGREVAPIAPAAASVASGGSVTVRIDAADACRRYSALVIRGVTIKSSPEIVRRRLEAVGLRAINNVVDVTNYVMLGVGHPLHAFDLDKIADATLVVRRGNANESIRSLDGETRKIDADTIVIADAKRAVALGGVIGGAESEIGDATRNIVLECAWFEPSFIRRTARRLGIKTDASYRFERRVDPNDTLHAIDLAGTLITQYAGGTREAILDVVAQRTESETLRLRTQRLHDASGGAIGIGYALELFRRLGFNAAQAADGIDVGVPTYRGDIHEEMDLIEEVLRFYGLDKVPSELPRVKTGDTRREPEDVAEDEIRTILVGCGLSEAINYSFIHPDHNPLFSDEPALAITNALTENLGAMRLSLLPGLLDNVVFNRSYGTRDGALFEVGRTYHRSGDGVRERRRVAIVMFGSVGSFWGDAKRPIDFFDIKGIVEQVAAKFHVTLTFDVADREWLKKGRRAVARLGDRDVATLGFLSTDVLARFGIKGDVAAAELDIESLIASTAEWNMEPAARFPGVPMVLGMTHARDLEYQKLIDTIRAMNIPHLHEVGLRDRFVPEGEENLIKTTLGMWYQAFDRSLTQDDVAQSQQQLASRLADALPVTLLQEKPKP
jgi:phenylalanyl-tRNA synthetase beta chain